MRTQPKPDNVLREHASEILRDALKPGDTLSLVERNGTRNFDIYNALDKNRISRLTWEIATVLYDKGARYDSDKAEMIVPNIGYNYAQWIREELGTFLFGNARALLTETL